MVIDYSHYRLYGELLQYESLPAGCAEYMKRKEKQLLVFLLSHKANLTLQQRQILNMLIARHDRGVYGVKK